MGSSADSHGKQIQPSESGDTGEDGANVFEEHSEEEETQLVRKLDRRILPIACLLYLFAYLDRSNLGNARLQGLPEDILGGDASGELFGWVVSTFYFSYILFQVPATIVGKLYPPRVWMACAAVGWGAASALMATAKGFSGLVLLRLLIGVFEAGFGPSLPLYFSFFYTKAEMGLRMAYWFAFATVAGSIGGFIAFGIQRIDTSVAHWKLLFIVEGLPPIVLGVLTVFLLPNRPESTSFFNERERKIALARMNRATRGDVGATVNKAHIFLALKDWRIYVGGVIYFGLNCALASISAFLPTIITTFGYTNALAQLLTVPPYATASVVLIGFSYASDKLQIRGVVMWIACCISAVGYLLLLSATNVHARYFATFCITSGTYTTIGITIAWFAHNLGSETKKATGMPMFMAIGQCGSILGSHIFPKAEGPAYTRGFSICCSLAFLAALCSILLSLSYRRDNAQRDLMYGKVNPRAPVDTRQLADKAPEFRYVP
ncbi:major facilitator superfamily domain-containing protein [Coprinopsis sp. MPI-PUGE-AT-0042]|nr:major facilitator superfamily domain-containing protein [Coprinopsis sp. MPI-PUGE-AT-0042]